MKITRFNEIHKALGAKMVEFAGFEMPIQYPNGIIHEHHVVREKVGVFDVSHMGEFEVRGADSLKFLQYLTLNDVAKLNKGNIQYSAMCFEDGGIVDDFLVYNLGDYYMLIVNGANIDKDWNWVNKVAKDFNVTLKKPKGITELSNKTLRVKVVLDNSSSKEFPNISDQSEN